MSEAENRARSLLREGRVDEMGSMLAEPFCGWLLADFELVAEKVRDLGEEEWEGLRERGII